MNNLKTEEMKLKIKKEMAKRLYCEVPEWFKKQLVEVFGKDCFRKRSFDEIKTFDDACEELGISTEMFSAIDSIDEIAYKKIKVVAKAINQGWTPDWTNTDQKKWWPWFILSSGFGFSDSGCDYDGTDTSVGSRLCTDTSEKAMYIAEQFKAEYQDYFLYSE